VQQERRKARVGCLGSGYERAATKAKRANRGTTLDKIYAYLFTEFTIPPRAGEKPPVPKNMISLVTGWYIWRRLLKQSAALSCPMPVVTSITCNPKSEPWSTSSQNKCSASHGFVVMPIKRALSSPPSLVPTMSPLSAVKMMDTELGSAPKVMLPRPYSGDRTIDEQAAHPTNKPAKTTANTTNGRTGLAAGFAAGAM
jgi:hypothetical protein